MSSSSNIPKSSSAVSSQDGHYIVPPQAIQSAISAHQKQSARIVRTGKPRHDELAELRTEFEAAAAAYFSGKMKQDDYDAVCKCLDEAHRAFRKRTTDYGARRAAGLTKPGDLYKVLYGCTDAEVEEFIREGSDRYQADVRRANEARSQVSRATAEQARTGPLIE
ncbi:hypothetical protein EWM64_g2774 [Hericium alpestre]|uniref:Uncharacterized protein n=1 Tax=Hericium alpestre TaxID=135208 RepID=A0A4Z0A2G1_9AGAM|nr:hypothetical protein EWM64_g2774 [Hericium alpestre]